jgi:hypothetical protein
MERPARCADCGLGCEFASNRSSEPQAEGAGDEGEVTISGFGCPRGNDCCSIAEPDGEVRSLGMIPNRLESVGELLKKLGPVEKLRACYEAGSTGYVLYWQLAELGVQCEVIAPSLIPIKAGDRVKTDRRDAEKLARSYRSGDLTAVWVPDEVPKRCVILCAHVKRRSRIPLVDKTGIW